MAEGTEGRSVRHERYLQGIEDEDLKERPAAAGRVRGENQEEVLKILKEDVEVRIVKGSQVQTSEDSSSTHSGE